MGFFSSNCEGCKHPLLSIYAANDINDWMISAVAITADGSVVKGSYDGYGRIDSPTLGEVDITGATVWHGPCWQVAGQPTDFRGASEDALDQGYFFTTEHDVPPPTKEAP